MRKRTTIRATVAAAAAFLLAAAAAGAAGTFEVRKVAETATTITLGWNPQPGADGYRFHKDGVAVSRTFDPARTTAKFSKDAQSYTVTVLRVSEGDTGSYPPPPPSTAQRFLSPAGNDSNPCTQTQPCRSMQRAATVAANGDTVQLAAGNYPQQTLANVTKTLAYKASGTVNLAGQLRIECTANITVEGVSAKNLLVAAGNRNLTVRSSSFGGGTYSASNEDDPVVIGNVGSCSSGTTSDGVLLDSIHVHDYFWQQNTGSAHTDCLQFYGGSANVTIRNSLFERCAESFIGAFPDFGNITNTVVEDTTFRDLWTNTGKGTFFAMQWGCPGHPYTASGITFRRNTWNPGVPVPIRTECGGFLVENNVFQTGPGQFGCDSWNSGGRSVVWRNNTFLNGGGCVTS